MIDLISILRVATLYIIYLIVNEITRFIINRTILTSHLLDAVTYIFTIPLSPVKNRPIPSSLFSWVIIRNSPTLLPSFKITHLSILKVFIFLQITIDFTLLMISNNMLFVHNFRTQELNQFPFHSFINICNWNFKPTF